MKARFYAFYMVLFLIVFMVGMVLWAITTTPNHGLPRKTLHCVQWVAGPTPVFACEDGHGYAVEHGKLIDLGRASSTPYLPSR